ncbi:MAG: hypothetical protein IKT56_06080 [Clostridia bacterium]|nr:hypothetical protein [Clostridia bacterium]
MDIEKILYEKGFWARVSDNADREYILKCTESLEPEIEKIDFWIEEIQDKFIRESEIFKEKQDRCFQITERIYLKTKKYNDTLSNDSIWGTVLDENEKKRNLKKYYSYISCIRELTSDIALIGIDIGSINDILYSVLETKKKIRLCEIASDIINRKCEKIGFFEEKLDELEKDLGELLNSEAKLSMTLSENESILGNYIMVLDTALDVKGKGLEMNISAARKSVAYFLAAFKRELK